MACTSPLFRIPVTCDSFKLLPRSDKKRVKNDGVFFFDLPAVSTLASIPGFNMDDVQRLRCGQCIDCRLAYSRDWAVRCSLEASLHKFNYFVTLTYDEYSIPRGCFMDYNGEIFDTNLCRRDVQLFMKNLREWERIHNNNTGIKVFYCGEYGSNSNTSRPHYHLCLFGVSEIPDLHYFCTRGSYKYYKSNLYESFWSDSKYHALRGFVDICEVSFDTIAYTARYCLKKQQGKIKKDFLEYYNTLEGAPQIRLQPFIGMSRRPGIASEYYELNKKQIHSEDLVKYQKKFELFQSKPPRYFDKLFDLEDPDAFAEVKERRRIAGLEASKVRKSLYSESELARMNREADILAMKEKKYYVRSL